MKIRRLFNNYDSLMNKINEDKFQGSSYIHQLKDLGFSIKDFGKITGSSRYDLYIVFSKDGKDGRIHFSDIRGDWTLNYKGKTFAGTSSDSLSLD